MDANVVIQAGKPPGGPAFARVADLVEAEFIEVLTTDLTIAEIAKKHVANDYDAIKDIARTHVRAIIKDAMNVALPDLSKDELKAALTKKYEASTRQMFDKVKAETLKIDDVKPTEVFSKYISGSGFFSGEGKKDQFSDAFIFECLKAASSKESPITIVSEDGDFESPVESDDRFSLVKSLPDLFKSLGLEVAAPEVGAFLEDSHESLVTAVGEEVDRWGLHAVDVMDADIDESKVTDVEMMTVTSFGASEKGRPVLVVGRMEVSANVSYTHPNWDEAAYDSEDKKLIPFDDVSGDSDISFEADFVMSIAVDKEGVLNEIEEFRFRNGDFQWVNLYSHQDYRD